MTPIGRLDHRYRRTVAGRVTVHPYLCEAWGGSREEAESEHLASAPGSNIL